MFEDLLLLETEEPTSYSNVSGQAIWEQAMRERWKPLKKTTLRS